MNEVQAANCKRLYTLSQRMQELLAGGRRHEAARAAVEGLKDASDYAIDVGAEHNLWTLMHSVWAAAAIGLVWAPHKVCGAIHCQHMLVEPLHSFA